MRQWIVGSSLATSLLFASGCNQINQLTASTLAVSVVTASPDLAAAVNNIEPGFAASLPLSDPAMVAQVDAWTEIMDRNSQAPVSNAAVAMDWPGGHVSFCPAGTAGTYFVDSLTTTACSSAGLAYAGGQIYTTTVSLSGSTYTMKVTAPAPVGENNVSFSPILVDTNIDSLPLSFPSAAANTALNVDWSNAAEAKGKNTFVTLARIDYNSPSNTWSVHSPAVVFNNMPAPPSDFISLVTSSPAANVTIPADRFVSQALYFLIVTTAALSTDTSDNLAIGAGALAGSGTAWVFWVP